MNRDALIAELTRDEALRLLVYDDATGKALTKGSVCVGHPTIGIGRALDVHGITAAEAAYLLDNDIDAIFAQLTARIPDFPALDDVRQRVLMNMAFNMGAAGLLAFHDTLRYLTDGRYELASRSMADSIWAKQTGARAVRLIGMMRSGEVQA